MALDSFLDLLITQRLNFTNAEKFSDLYESEVPHQTLEHLERDMKRAGMKHREIRQRINHICNRAAENKRSCWVNCWSVSPHESYALWKIYLRNSSTGVAIKTNIKNLMDAIDLAHQPNDPNIYISRVKYTHHLDPKLATSWKIATYKTPFYEYEKELRLLIVANHDSPSLLGKDADKGYGVRVDLPTLIDKVYLSPFCGEWFNDPFKKTIRSLFAPVADRISFSRVRDR